MASLEEGTVFCRGEARDLELLIGWSPPEALQFGLDSWLVSVELEREYQRLDSLVPRVVVFLVFIRHHGRPSQPLTPRVHDRGVFLCGYSSSSSGRARRYRPRASPGGFNAISPSAFTSRATLLPMATRSFRAIGFQSTSPTTYFTANS